MEGERGRGWPEKKEKRASTLRNSLDELSLCEASLSADTCFKRFVGCVAVFVGAGETECVL